MNRARMEIHCDEAALKGITGKGVGVAVLDTGIYLHEDLKGKIQGFKDFVHGKKLPYDDNGHGTHIAAMIAGSGLASGGLLKGIAPGSSITAIKVLDHRGNGYAADVLMGLRWIREHRKEYGIRIINISVGSIYSVLLRYYCRPFWQRQQSVGRKGLGPNG